MSVTDDRIQPALHALLDNDPAGLDAALRADPHLVNASWNGNTLLEWVTQPPHGIEPGVVDVLIDHGANPDRALNLAGCWNLPDLCRQLLAAGANPAARADGNITPLESAAMHGSTESADVLVTEGVHRNCLWLAAATGQLALVRAWVAPDGVLLRRPGDYRPNWADVGRPRGSPPTEDPSEILGEAFVFAAANGRFEVVDYLLDAGVDVDSRPYRNTTGLHLAIQFQKVGMVQHLLDRGARTDIRDDQYRSDAAGWAAACNDGTDVAGAVAALVTARD